MAMCAVPKMGASGSLLIETMWSLPFMQLVNWMAPLTPQVMISFGRTVRPERPI